jgi:hypothetical protein
MNIIKLSFENERGKYKLFTTEGVIMDIIKNIELFNNTIVDAKTGEIIIHKERIIAALKIEKPKEQ